MAGKKDAFYSQVKQLGVLTTIPMILLAGPAIGFFLGSWADRKAHTYPWFTLVFIFMGFLAPCREIMRILKQVLKEDEEDDPIKKDDKN